ncbi:MAG: hypothetical protein ABI789_01095 [Usitatibacter sp.]
MTRTLLRAFSLIFTCAIAGAFAPAASAFLIDFQHTDVTEFVNDFTGHYFLADSIDTTTLNRGGAGGGWRMTGHVLRVYYSNYGQPVCRFYAPGPNTHFFTASADECGALRAHPEYGWIYEGVKFGVDPPSGGSCAGSLSNGTIHRYYNNRFAFNDSNHRYVDAGDSVSRADLQARGWTDEGVAFCAYYTTHVAAKSFVVDSNTAPVRPASECRNQDIVAGGCIALDGIAGPMSRRINSPSFPSPSLPRGDPQWSSVYSDLTGLFYPVFTNQLGDDPSTIAAHSFVQLLGTGLGMRVSSLDHFSGIVGSIDPMYLFVTRAPVLGFADQRVYPWRRPHEASVEIAFRLYGGIIRKGDAGSHAWGAAAIAFQDATTSQRIDVTLQTYGTIAPGDFTGAVDATNDDVYVSTVFRADPAFGTRVLGSFVPCTGNGACAMGDFNGTQYAFRLGRDDFLKVLVLARAANPRLSPNPDDYHLVNFRFQNGIVGDASLGAGLTNLRVDLFGY